MARRTRGVPWTNLVNVVETGDRLIKAGGVNATWDAGADTRAVGLIPGGRDGWIEFWADSRGMNAMMGLSYQGTSAGFADIDFAIYVSADQFQVYEAGALIFNGGAASYPIAAGLCRVERLGGTIYYKLDGTTLHSHALTAAQRAAALYADASFYKLGDYLVGWRMSIDELDTAAPICAPLRGDGHLAVVVSAFLSSGTLRFSTSPIASAADGFYYQKLISVPRLSRSIGDRSYSVNGVQFDVVVADDKGELVQILATAKAQGSQILIESASQDVPNASWLVEFSGRLHTWRQSVPVEGVATVALTVRSDDLALSSPTPDGTITNADFATITPEAIGSPERQVYGRHHAQGIAGVAAGVLKAPCVQPWDGVTWQGYVANGVVRLTQVFVGGVAQTGPGTWSASTPTLGGRWMTNVVLFVDPGDAEVTVSCDGYDWLAQGTGWQNYLGGPEHWADVIKHWLSNFVFKKWKLGAWYQADPTRIDLASLADVKLALGRVAAGRVVMSTGGDGKSAQESLNEACASVGVYPVFTREGRIGFVLDDPLVSASDQYNAPLILSQRSGPWDATWPGDGLAKRVLVSFAHSQADGKFLGTHEVQDPDVANDRMESLQAPWSPTMLLTPPTSIVTNDAGSDPVLTAWIRAKNLLQDYNNGDSVAVIRDLSPLGHDFQQATGANQPKFRGIFARDERAWIEFDGVNDSMSSGIALSNFKVAGGWTCLIALRVRAFTHAAAVVGTVTTAKCGIGLYNSAGLTGVYFFHDDGALDQVIVTGMLPYQWYVVCARHVGGKVYLGVNDARKLQMATLSSANTVSLAENFAVCPGGVAPVDIAELVIFKDDAGENTLRAMDHLLAEHVFRFKSSNYAAKDLGSRYLQIYRQPRMNVSLKQAPAELAVLELGRLVRLEQPLGSGPTVGWGASAPAARPFRIAAIERDPIPNTLDLGLVDVHDVCTTWRDTGITIRGVDTGKADWARQEGVARLG